MIVWEKINALNVLPEFTLEDGICVAELKEHKNKVIR